jgi:uncharacterized membrane protein YgdD (TMEM256/DUF423 family)
MLDRTFFIVSGIFGFLGVALGAFGSHGLRASLAAAEDGAARAAWWSTAVQYHLVHTFAIALAGLLASRHAGAAPAVAGWAFTGGVVLFSGSLYLMTLTGARALGAVTPFGGLLLLAGWGAIVLAAATIR